MTRSIAFVACVNDDKVLSENLLRSPCIKSHGVTQKFGYKSASLAYNEAIEVSDADLMVFVHQDVYIPDGWIETLFRRIETIEATDPDWAVLGVAGKSASDDVIGYVWSSGMNVVVGAPGFGVRRALCLDELLIVVRRNAGIIFDSDFKGFHMYGTDIVQIANQAGRTSYLVEAPVVHNSKPISTFFGGYSEAYAYMSKKWLHVLPIESSCAKVTRFGLGFLKMKILHRLRRKANNQPRLVVDAIDVSKRLGFE